jgi:hypothetical protein
LGSTYAVLHIDFTGSILHLLELGQKLFDILVGQLVVFLVGKFGGLGRLRELVEKPALTLLEARRGWVIRDRLKPKD